MAPIGRLRARTLFIFGLVLFSCCLANADIDGNMIGRRLLGKDSGEEKSSKSSGSEKSSKDAPATDPAASAGADPSAAAGGGATASPGGGLDITKFGAVADGKTDSSAAIMKAWQSACAQPAAKITIPKGSFMTKPVVLQGPCKNSKPLAFELLGTLVATTDISAYPEDTWILFSHVSNILINGGGTFDGTGASAWKLNDCKTNKDCARLPSSVKFQRVENGVVSGITSLNAKYFHFHVTDSSGIKFDNIKITAPADSPNTDGIHFSDTSGITVSNAVIGTGDDCISVGPGVVDATYTGITCGPGHGLSIGSIGKKAGEAPVKGVSFIDCTINGADNGARIKSFGDSPPGTVSGITFQGITMKDVENPIIIDQNYGHKGTSKTVITDVHFKDIKGTSKTPVSILLDCSPANPCQAELSNINLSGTAKCTNAEVTGGPSVPSCGGGGGGGGADTGAAAGESGEGGGAGAEPAAKGEKPAKGQKSEKKEKSGKSK